MIQIDVVNENSIHLTLNAFELHKFVIYFYFMQSHVEYKFIVLFDSVLYGFIAVITLLVICECVQRFTNTFEEFNVILTQLRWYRYPIDIQRMLIPIIAYVQIPFVINVFGSIGPSREQFRKVNGGLKFEF